MSRNTLLLVSLLGAAAIWLAPATASAEHGLGVGAQAMITGPLGASVTYDAGQFHIDGILGLYDDDIGTEDTDIHLGARFYWTIHERGVSDLSVGGGLGIINGADTDVHIEGSAKIRIWLVSNVSFSTAIGLAFVIEGNDNDDDDFALGSQLTSGVNTIFGVTYHFN